MATIREAADLQQIYQYQQDFSTPYFFPAAYEGWEKSFLDDVDGEGRKLFKELFVKAAYEEEKLVGFIQYGKTAFGFDDRGRSLTGYPTA